MDFCNQKEISIAVKSNGSTQQYFIDTIIYIESKNKEIFIYFIDNKKLEIYNTLKEIENKLKEYNFYQINRNIIFNLRFFKSLDSKVKRCFTTTTGIKMTVSRRKWCEFKGYINN